ncbi:MAG TPA: BatB protein, partial [Gammaproteobacteria bacterium]
MIEFEWPWLFAVLPLPWVLRQILAPTVQARQAALRTPFLQDFTDSIGADIKITGSRLLPAAIVAWLLLVTAAARPQWIGAAVELPVSGRDLMLAIDLSPSMEE